MKTNELISTNPYTLKVVGKYKIDSAITVQRKINAAHKAFDTWRSLTVKQRGTALKKLAKALLTHKQALAEMAAIEMGKPVVQGIAEVEKCARSIQYYIDNGANILADRTINTSHQRSFISHQPLGVVLAIMPWNFPFWQVYRALGAIMISGNTLVLKHASNVTGCAMLMKEIWDAAGLPSEAFQVLKIQGASMDAIIAHEKIAAVTFTGSTVAGKKVAATAAAHLKKQVLELGGSDGYVIMDDADLDDAARLLVQSRMNNAGQSCISAKRLIITKKNAEVFIDKIKDNLAAYTVGDPLDKATTIGTMARVDLRDELHAQVEQSVRKGARLLMGGKIISNNAAYPPTLLTHVKKGMPAYDEELFGPVVAIIIANDEADALRIINDTNFGLGGGIFSTNIKKATRLAATHIQAGAVVVNNFLSSDPLMPFGGIKESGYGRELCEHGVYEFCNIKTINID